MKISIITPSYNQSAFIENCILSVLNQGFENFEHIIMDGGSNDGTIEILKRYPHLIWISEKDEGQSAAINAGFKKATGDILGWLNTDEEYSNGVFENIHNEFKKGDVDVVYGNYVSIRDGNSELIESIPYVNGMLNWRQFINTMTLFVSRKVIDDGHFINPRYEAAMDKEYLLRLESVGYRYRFLKLNFGNFYWHNDNKSTRIRDIQKKESKLIILHYYFNDNKYMFKLFFWPIKLAYDVLYVLIRFFNKWEKTLS